MKTGLKIHLKDPLYPTMVRECQLTRSSAGHLNSSNCKLMWHLKWTLPNQNTVGPELHLSVYRTDSATMYIQRRTALSWPMMGFLLSLHLFFLFIISSGKFMAAIRHPATPIVLAGSGVARFVLV
jgi:hypothetical protein